MGRQITDAGLAQLKGLTNLQTLELDYTQITDAGLVHLKGLTKLERPNISFFFRKNNQITDAGVASLQRVLPNCKIEK